METCSYVLIVVTHLVKIKVIDIYAEIESYFFMTVLYKFQM